MSNDRVRLQNLRDFTVQIRHAKTDAIVGTGIAVSTDGKIVTCAHVVLAAGVNPRTGRPIPGHWALIWESIWGRKPDALADAGDAEVGVYFPQAGGGEEKARRATVAACFPRHDDDVVLLQLVGGPAPLSPEQIAVLGTAVDSARHEFESFGYRRLRNYQGLPALGQIVRYGDKPIDRVLHGKPVMLISQHIDSGMSGAAVLDVVHNLVVGVIAETWDSRGEFADRDTNFAVDAYVLNLSPFNLPIQRDSLELRPVTRPETDIQVARVAGTADLDIALSGAPPPFIGLVERKDLLKAISADWADPKCHVTALIGGGGVGKSTLSRSLLDSLLVSDTESQPDGVFWWNFYNKRSVDEFFEAALSYVTNRQVDPHQYPSTNKRMRIIGGILDAKRYLFILDGLEVMQYQEGDQYGLLKSADLREFLEYCAAPGHQSFCLITSRVPVLDLMNYTTYNNRTYRHRDVSRLSTDEGRALLRQMGVRGSDAAIEKVVADWEGHALALNLLGVYLVRWHQGEVDHIGDIGPPAVDEPHDERIYRLLHCYDAHLAEAERVFLILFSAFRTPVDEAALGRVFRAKPMDTKAINAPIAALDSMAFYALVKRLVEYRILRYEPQECRYMMHQLIRAYYFDCLTGYNHAQIRTVHECIRDYYLASADIGDAPILEDLMPVIEAVHHVCRAGCYDEAFRLVWQHIYQNKRRLLVDQLSAYQTALELMLEFFPGGDTSQEPLVSEPFVRRFILNEVGLSLMRLGRLGEARTFYERSVEVALQMKDWINAVKSLQSLADLQCDLGLFVDSKKTAGQALAFSHVTEDKVEQARSLARQAWGDHLCGDLEAAGAAFQEAETLQQKSHRPEPYLYLASGVYHAEHLRRLGRGDYARYIMEANIEICERNRWPDELSLSHRVLGDLYADAGQHDTAREHYYKALEIAQSITRRDILIEALLARGRWAARWAEDMIVRSDLTKALGYARMSGYRRYEIDVRIGLAWMHIKRDDLPEARAEAKRAQRMSVEIDYYWGQVDAAEVLAVLGYGGRNND